MRGTGRRRQRSERKLVAAPAYVTRNIPFVEFVNEEGLVKLEEQADWIIQEIGIEFRDDPEVLGIWKEAGADIQGERVRFEPGMLRENGV